MKQNRAKRGSPGWSRLAPGGIPAGVLALLCLFGACVPASEPQAALPDGEKEIPRITFKNLSPPYLDYDYFRESDAHPFQYDADGFSLVNAWWLAEASTLVYADVDFVRERFRAAGLPQVRFFEGRSTQCYVAHNDDFAIVAFRGSEIWKKRDQFDLEAVTADMRTNIDIRPVPWEQGGKVHRGFAEALDEVWPQLLAHMEGLHERGCRIWITGHSLGAALATLCASRYCGVRGAYTFGSPRVGNKDFARHLSVDIYRIVNSDDIVPELNYPGDYVHVGTLKFIDQKGLIQGISDESVAANVDLSRNGNGGSLIPAAFRDHVPLLYAVHLWNNLVRQVAKQERSP